MMISKRGSNLHIGAAATKSVVRIALVLVAAAAIGACDAGSQKSSVSQDSPKPQTAAESVAAQFKPDFYWPKTLPEVRGEKSQPRHVVLGGVGGVCIDSKDNVVALNRTWKESGDALLGMDPGSWAMEAPPIVIFDPEGNIKASWGDRATLPQRLHGCFVDYRDTIWISGILDGIVQQYSMDGKLLLQIGTKDVCDGPETDNPNAPGQKTTCAYPSPKSMGYNTSKTLLYGPAGVVVDASPDPVTNEPGSVYIAEGYGNQRIVVFDSKGNYLRQWGAPGEGTENYAPGKLGNPHCIRIGNDNLVYVCGRDNDNILVYDKLGKLIRNIPVDLSEYAGGAHVESLVAQLVFSRDKEQSRIYAVDGLSNRIWVIDRESGKVLGGIGHVGNRPGEIKSVLDLATDSKGNLYTGEGTASNQVQRFILQK